MSTKPSRHERFAVKPDREASRLEVRIRSLHKRLIITAGVGEEDS